MSDKAEPQLRVVDRRWWARRHADDARDEGAARKSTMVEELERQLADNTAQLRNVQIEHRRALDEFEQANGRIRRDVAREVEHGKRAVIADLLDVVDNLDRAIAAARDDEAERGEGPLLKGVRLVRDQFLEKLQAFGVTRVETLGHPFDATRHEAISTTPASDPAQDGTVVGVVREGYAIGDELLRPASVVVGKAD